jgi:signal transduction histidine kinase
MSDDGKARLEIADTGVGIPPVHLECLRSCLDRPGDIPAGNGSSIGLGLPIATALVRQHGGQIEIDSGAGRGTQVSIVLPLGKRGAAGGESLMRRRTA